MALKNTRRACGSRRTSSHRNCEIFSETPMTRVSIEVKECCASWFKLAFSFEFIKFTRICNMYHNRIVGPYIGNNKLQWNLELHFIIYIIRTPQTLKSKTTIMEKIGSETPD